MNMNNFLIEKELSNLENERKIIKQELENEQIKISNMLKSEMGNDITNVLNGKIKVKLSFKEKLNIFINKIFNTF